MRTQNFRIIAWTSEFKDGSRKVDYELLKETETDTWEPLGISYILAAARKALLIHAPSSCWLVQLIWQSTSQANRTLISSASPSAVSGPGANDSSRRLPVWPPEIAGEDLQTRPHRHRHASAVLGHVTSQDWARTTTSRL